MSEKRSQYDTDPLDPDFVKRADELMGKHDDPTRALPDAQSERASAPVEEPTRRLPEPYPSSYPSVFVPPTYEPPRSGYTSFGASAQPQTQGATPPVQTPYAPPPVAPGMSSPYPPYARPSSRHVTKLGLPENIANILPYAPFHVGLVIAVIELLLVPRAETRTRFHAAQGLALNLTILALTFVFGFIEAITDNSAGGRIFKIAAFVFLIFSMWRVWEGRPHHLAPLDDATKFLNEKIAPRT